MPKSQIANYKTKVETICIGDISFQICTLADRDQSPAPESLPSSQINLPTEAISSAIWSYFGTIWPSGLVLADAMSQYPIGGKKILEIGSGIALASLVLHQRGGNITVSDYNPMVESFLLENVAINQLPPLKFQQSDWTQANSQLGKFDLIIGSDILYERGHPQIIADFIDRHISDSGQIIIVDPGRDHHRKFYQVMMAQGYCYSEEKIRDRYPDSSASRGRIMTYSRSFQTEPCEGGVPESPANRPNLP
ncbi:class I SAM-dependent methyltransferase [Alkalinema pantanalense CENA528]|uniref:class I SAM-dependent methyltransferase n=1 Tax=Alkalinema pantanalense TaxID=1620705 RepID=UPI003D6E3F58